MLPVSKFLVFFLATLSFWCRLSFAQEEWQVLLSESEIHLAIPMWELPVSAVFHPFTLQVSDLNGEVYNEADILLSRANHVCRSKGFSKVASTTREAISGARWIHDLLEMGVLRYRFVPRTTPVFLGGLLMNRRPNLHNLFDFHHYVFSELKCTHEMNESDSGSLREPPLSGVHDPAPPGYKFLISRKVVPPSPEIWRSWSSEGRQIFLENHAGEATGLNIFLSITDKNAIPALAAKLGGRDLEFRISKYYEKVKGNPFPLEEVLPLFVRSNLDQYTRCDGPNCFHSALSVDSGFLKEPAHIEPEEFVAILCNDYEFVPAGSDLRVGDIFVYAINLDVGAIVHAATHVVDNIVFVKNGMSQFRPYLFQFREESEYFYSRDNSGFLQLVFRRRGL